MGEFSLLSFAAHLMEAVEEVEHEAHEAIESAAVLVEKRAKSYFGTYQSGAGPFMDWSGLKDVTKADRLEQGFPEDEPLLRTGDTRDSIHHAVEGREAIVGSDSEIFEAQELGTKHNPPRSTLGIAAARSGAEIADIIGQGALKALIGKEVHKGRIDIT